MRWPSCIRKNCSAEDQGDPLALDGAMSHLDMERKMLAIALTINLIGEDVKIRWYVWVAAVWDVIVAYPHVRDQLIEWFGS